MDLPHYTQEWSPAHSAVYDNISFLQNNPNLDRNRLGIVAKAVVDSMPQNPMVVGWMRGSVMALWMVFLTVHSKVKR